MSRRTAWTASREELVAALQKARLSEAAARAVLADYEARREVRKAREREAAAARKAQRRAADQVHLEAAFRHIEPDPLADWHRFVLNQALTTPRYRKEQNA